MALIILRVPIVFTLSNFEYSPTKIHLQKLVDICGYELPINLQNFTQKDLTEVKILQKVSGALLF